MISIRCRPVRNAWLEALYQHNIIEASERTRSYADKLFFYSELYDLLGAELLSFHPKTMGLQAFALKYGLRANSPLHEWEAALQQEFQGEIILKPVAVMNTAGEQELYLFSKESFLKSLAQKNEQLTSALERTSPFVPPLLQAVASGEEFLLQDHIASLAGKPIIEKTKHYQEIRVHTFEDQVIIGGSYSRWLDNEINQEEYFYWAQDFVQSFLNKLPHEFLKGQAWALDILVFDNKVMRILEANTNRGKRGQWSGFLSRPELMGAYTRYIEKTKSIRFRGFSGFLLRHNFANLTKNFKKKYIEGIR